MRYRAVARQELKEQFRQPRALWVFVVALVFFGLAFWQGAERVGSSERAQRLAQAENWNGWLAQDAQNPHGAAHYPLLLAKPSAPLAGLVEGNEAALGGHVFTDAHRVLPVRGTRTGDKPIAQAVGGLDAAFVVGVVLSLMAALSGADLVAGEKERGTLRLVFANPVGRRRWLLAKLGARTIALWLTVGAGALAAWLLSGGVPLGEGWAWRMAAFGLASGLYLSLWLGLGALCSTLASRVGPAVLAAIALWVGLVLVLPRVLVAGAELADSPPSSAPATLAVRVAEVKLRQAQYALVEAAAARGELASGSAFVQMEGPSHLRAYIDAKAARARAEADAPLVAWRDRQFERLGALSYLSPSALYFHLASFLAGTDYHRHADFVAQAGTYRQAFLAKLNGMEDAGVETFSDYRSMTSFRFQEAASGRMLPVAAWPLAGLGAFALACLMLTLGAIRRYDMR